MLRLNRRAFNLSLLATGASALAAPALTGRAAATPRTHRFAVG